MNTSDPVKPRAKRRYRAPRRQQQAQETRARLLAAARRLFVERGYAATPLTAVARVAGVSVETLYAHFGSKRALLSALVEAAADEAALQRLAGEILAEPDPRGRLSLVARLVRAIYEASWDIIQVLRDAGTADAAAAAAWREADARGRAAQTPILGALAESGALIPTLATQEAADILWALAGPDLYRLLVAESSWTAERYERWLSQALATLLLRP